MRYSPETYAEALIGAVDKIPGSAQNTTLKRFLEVVKKNGDWSGLKKILAATRTMLVKKAGGRVINLEFARGVSEETISKFSKAFSQKDHIEIAVNPRLVAGMRITIDGEKELDNSLQRKLTKLFT